MEGLGQQRDVMWLTKTVLAAHRAQTIGTSGSRETSEETLDQDGGGRGGWLILKQLKEELADGSSLQIGCRMRERN